MTSLALASAAWIALHRLVAGSRLRGALAEAIGERAFGWLFQAASLAGLLWLGFAYAAADRGAPLWNVPRAVDLLQLVLQPAAVFLILAGAATPNPGTFRQEAVASGPSPVQGVLRITRHPFLWGMALASAGHILATPTPRNLLLFGALLVTGLAGTASIDRKRRRTIGHDWSVFADQTSNVPFAAILAGRQTLRFREFKPAVLAAAAGVSLLLALAHRWLFGAPAVS